MYKKNSGFTLIELVIVIVILGILAVTAAPKFINFSDDAYKAKNQGFFGAFSSAIKMAEAKARVSGIPPHGRLTIGGTKLKFYNYWPECKAGHNIHCSDDNEPEDGKLSALECNQVWDALMQEPNTEYNVRGDGASDNDWTCWFRLKDEPSIGFNYRATERLLELVDPST
ncbi:type II secretion system protein [Parashewanella tropica]|uniref:type II secretion system protein n=1 Tax=Parashewanella tropica TaxID=2547970 RepID=UPI0010597145|nr:type II secretion system protein [Parashewanella tropica]